MNEGCFVCCKDTEFPTMRLEAAQVGVHAECLTSLRHNVRDADVIFCIDRETAAEHLFHGRAWLQLIAAGMEGPQGVDVNVLRIPIDFKTDALEFIAAVCITEGKELSDEEIESLF